MIGALVALAPLAACGCGSEPTVASTSGESLRRDVREACDASPASDAPVDGGLALEPSPLATMADASEPDAASYPIMLRWSGKYVFDELPFGCPQCLRYRIVIDACPGPCTVHVDVDGRRTKRRLEGAGHATGNREELAVLFTAARDDDPVGSDFSPGAVLVTLEVLPGSLLLLRFGALVSSNGSASLIVPRGPMAVMRP